MNIGCDLFDMDRIMRHLCSVLLLSSTLWLLQLGSATADDITMTSQLPSVACPCVSCLAIHSTITS